MNINIKKYDITFLTTWDEFVLNESINGIIYHTQNFLSYHGNRFIDSSIIIFDNKKMIGVFPCCIYNNEFYSHKGSTCGGLVFSEEYNTLEKLNHIMNSIYDFFKGKIYIKLSERIYFKNKNNDLINFVLFQKCKQDQDISMYFDINKNTNIIDCFEKSDNKRLLLKYKNKNFDIKIDISTSNEDYILFYNLLINSLKKK